MKHSLYKLFTYLGLAIIMVVGLATILPDQAHAQDGLRRMTVEQQTTDRILVFASHPDRAAVVITSSIPGLQIDTNLGIVADQSEPGTGEYRIILEPSRQIIYIDAPGFIRAVFQTGNLNPRDVIHLTVEPEAPEETLVSVVINVQPADAILFIDDQIYPANETIRLPEGPVSVRIEREGSRSISETITVSNQNILFNYSLEEIEIVLIQVRSANIGATVTINGMSQGEIDRSGSFGFFLYPDSYTLQLNQSGFISQTRQIEVTESSSNTYSMDLLRNIGELALQITPPDAKVLVNRVDYSGQRLIELAPGRYRLEVEKDYHEHYSETIEIPLNQRISRVISLEAHTGTLQFSVTPNDALAELVDASGRVLNRWTGTQIHRNIQAGLYTLRVSSAGHIAKEQRVTIQHNQTAQVTLELEEGALENWTRDTETTVVEVTNPATGRVWMDRNLGANRAARSATDSRAYGDLYQWGRGADGHQKRNSPTTTTLSSTDQPGHGSFILAPNSPGDWRSPQNNSLWQGVNGINNPCPSGYRLPTDAEWNAEASRWSTNYAAGAFASPLKLPLAGGRVLSSGSLGFVGSYGHYWSGSVSGTNARGLRFDSSNARMRSNGRAYAFSVRCLRD
jgi:uncharacterized protein (TIGR02145 family)